MPQVLPLTDMKIKALVPREKSFKAFDGHGLYLEVYPTGSKIWRIRYSYQGKERRISLGAYPGVGLKDARIKASEVKAMLRDGLNPAGPAKSNLAEGPTFAEVVEDWAGRFLVETQASPKTIIKKRIFLDKHILPKIGHLPIKDIEPPVILNEVMRPVEARGNLETTHRIKSICSQVFRFAVATGWAKRDPTQDLKGAVPPPKVKHRSTIIDPERIALLLRDIDNYSGHAITRYALALLPLVFLRPGELRHGEWSEIDWDNKVWRIPEHRMKMRVTHIVPLSRQALDILTRLKTLTGRQKFLFPGQRGNDRPMSDMAINAALRYLGYSGDDITGHGFRSMASTILNEQGYNRDWIERQLAHSERDGIRAAYNYAESLPERRKMMQDWADYLYGLMNLEAQ